jgi:16S rRNA G966 N2-methylase RsmD
MRFWLAVIIIIVILLIGVWNVIWVGLVMFVGSVVYRYIDRKDPGGIHGGAGASRGKSGNTMHSARDTDFSTESYDITTDDQAGKRVPTDAQEYLNRDFSKVVEYRFPKFDDTSAMPPKFAAETPSRANAIIMNQLKENVNWTNKTISYARGARVGKHFIKCVIQPLYARGVFTDVVGSSTATIEPHGAIKPITVVDTTGNIGGDSIGLAMERFVNRVIVHEMQPDVFAMLKANIDLYGYTAKIDALAGRFNYAVPHNSLVIIDPPYEADNNIGNFNLSIDSVPIYEVCRRILETAAVVIITMPRDFKYNRAFAEDNNQHVSAYQMGDKNNKMFVIMHCDRAARAHLPNFTSHKVISTDRGCEVV